MKMPNKEKSSSKRLTASGIALLIFLLPLLGAPLHDTLTLCLRKNTIHQVNTTGSQKPVKPPSIEKCTSVHVILIYAEVALIIAEMLAIIAVIKNKPKLHKLTAILFWSLPVLIVAAELYGWIRFHNTSALLHSFWFFGIWTYSYFFYLVVSLNINLQRAQMYPSESDSDMTEV